VNKVFMVEHMFALFLQKAQVVRIREAIKLKGMFIYDAFVKFDHNNNGLLSADELYGAVDYLNIKQMGAEDILDFMELADTSQDGNISYQELVDVLTDPDEVESLEIGEEDVTPADLPLLRQISMSGGQDTFGGSIKGISVHGKQFSTTLIIPKGEQELVRLLKLRKQRREEQKKLEEEREKQEQVDVSRYPLKFSEDVCLGDLVTAPFLERDDRPGEVVKIHDNGAFDILFDHGAKEIYVRGNVKVTWKKMDKGQQFMFDRPVHDLYAKVGRFVYKVSNWDGCNVLEEPSADSKKLKNLGNGETVQCYIKILCKQDYYNGYQKTIYLKLSEQDGWMIEQGVEEIEQSNEKQEDS